MGGLALGIDEPDAPCIGLDREVDQGDEAVEIEVAGGLFHRGHIDVRICRPVVVAGPDQMARDSAQNRIDRNMVGGAVLQCGADPFPGIHLDILP